MIELLILGVSFFKSCERILLGLEFLEGLRDWRVVKILDLDMVILDRYLLIGNIVWNLGGGGWLFLRLNIEWK